jgi:hypothetical protein
MHLSANVRSPMGVLLAFSPDANPPPPPRSRRSIAVPIGVGIALVVAGLIVAIAQNQKAAAIRNVPPAARGAIFEESLSEVKSTCLQSYASKGPLRDLCLDKARLILLFPECDPGCRVAANAVLPHAHK